VTALLSPRDDNDIVTQRDKATTTSWKWLIEVDRSSEASVTWDLGHPIVQVLVLRAVL
jgi:hypothetical protein